MSKKESIDEKIARILGRGAPHPVAADMPESFIAASQNTDRVVSDRFEPSRYEASVYYFRAWHKPVPDYELPYYLTRLTDVYVDMVSVIDVIGFVKEMIQNPVMPPEDDGIFKKVLVDHQVPFASLGWGDIEQKDGKYFQCWSDIFKFNNELDTRLKIGVSCTEIESLPLGRY